VALAVSAQACAEGASDTTPPRFGGAVSAVAVSETTVTVAWDAAEDDGTPPEALRYRVYVGTTEVDLTVPAVVTHAGATSAGVSALAAGTEHRFIVRAVDAAGNEDDHTRVVTARTLEHQGPVFSGLASLSPGDRGELALAWSAAQDANLPAAQIRYRVYVATTSGAQDFAFSALTTAPGATEAVLSNLDEGRRYFVVVRAVGAGGVEERNTIERSEVTRDFTPPSFGGAVSASARGTTVTVSWAPASDNVSAEAELRYDVYRAGQAGAQDFGTPTATVTGAASAVLTGLEVSTTSFIVVRARDAAGNQEANTVEVSATTADRSDVAAPAFRGAERVADVTATSARVLWSAATDDESPASAISYRVYLGPSTSVLNFASPVLVTAPGALSANLSGLAPETTYVVVVRAVDAAGNDDANTNDVSFLTTPDVTAPSFAGLASVTALSPLSLRLDWAAATDDVTGPGALRYLVFAAEGGAVDYGSPVLTTAPGATSVVLSSLAPATTYTLAVRALDAAGNVDTNTVTRAASTPADTTPLVFGGVSSVSAVNETTLAVAWGSATDDTTPPEALVYLVCCAASPTACTSTFVPSIPQTPPGATGATVTGLSPASSYTCVVRVRDAFGNVDENAQALTQATPPDTQPPTFAGVTSVSGASETSLTVNWSPATDNVTPSASIRYAICRTTSTGGCAGLASSSPRCRRPGRPP
jgi:hypothetical protein